MHLASRPATGRRTFGFYRFEILAAVLNAVLLFAIATYVLVEAWQRFSAQPEIATGPVLVTASAALIANLFAASRLRGPDQASLTLRAAYLEVMNDALGSAAVVISAAIIALAGWRGADAVASALIGLLILPRTWSLLREAVDVLLEATPRNVDMDEVREHILEAPGVRDVHDLHAWTITSGMNVVSAHVVIAADGNPGDVLDHLGRCLADDFDVNHSTFQLETPEHVAWEARLAQPQH